MDLFGIKVIGKAGDGSVVHDTQEDGLLVTGMREHGIHMMLDTDY